MKLITVQVLFFVDKLQLAYSNLTKFSRQQIFRSGLQLSASVNSPGFLWWFPIEVLTRALCEAALEKFLKNLVAKIAAARMPAAVGHKDCTT